MVLGNRALRTALILAWVAGGWANAALAQVEGIYDGMTRMPTADAVFTDPLNDGPVLVDPMSGGVVYEGMGGGMGWSGPRPWSVEELVPRDVILFAGVQGFKTATDLGRNGNFGFHEGVNLGGLFGDPWGFGYQAGAQAVHSDFKGNQILSTETGEPQFDDSPRNQVFVTGAVFRRVQEFGLQGGTAIDYFHDSYYETTDLLQLRTEWSLVWPQSFAIGFWGAFGVSREHVHSRLNPETPLNYVLAPKDMYSVFYRRYFTGGGEGRVSLGLSGMADVLVGAELSIPLGTSWALENNFSYVLPKHGASSGGQMEESFAVSIQLVWYPGRSAYDVHRSPSYPLFNVADNSVFLVDHR